MIDILKKAVTNHNRKYGEWYGKIKKEDVLLIHYVGKYHSRCDLKTILVFTKNTVGNLISANSVQVYELSHRPEVNEILYLNESNSHIESYKYKWKDTKPEYFKSILKWNNMVISEDFTIYDMGCLELDYTNMNINIIDELC